MVVDVRPIVLDTHPYGHGSVKNDLVHYKKNLQHIGAVSSRSPPLHQMPEPSLLFPSMIAAFLTGSEMDELDRRLHMVGSTEEVWYTYQSTGGSEPHEQ